MSPIFGKLTWSAIPFQEPIPLITSIVVIIALAAVALWVTKIKAWPFLWHEYITSCDHKRIGIMYIVLGLVMLVRGFADAIMMRSHQFLAVGTHQGYLNPEHYDQIFSAHGVIMIFFVAMPLIIGFMNFAVPLQLGVRDVAFPTLNNVSFWLTASGALLVNMSLFLGEFARTGCWPSRRSARRRSRRGWASIITSWPYRYPGSGRHSRPSISSPRFSRSVLRA